MSVIFEAVLLVGDLTVVRAAFNSLRVPLALELHQADQQGFVILTKFEEPGRVFQWEQVDRLAASLSVSFGTTLSVHYDDRGDIRVACLFQDGAVVRELRTRTRSGRRWMTTGILVTTGPVTLAINYHGMRSAIAFDRPLMWVSKPPDSEGR